MWTELYRIDGPWPGKLGLAARPRGGDWLKDEIAAWKRVGVSTVVSLLTPQEEQDLTLESESGDVKSQNMTFLSFPIADREVPSSEEELTKTLDKFNTDLTAGKNVALHCRQGIGRTGLVAACLLVAKGWNPEMAAKRLSAVRGVPIPETQEQRRWIDHYAMALASSE